MRSSGELASNTSPPGYIANVVSAHSWRTLDFLPAPAAACRIIGPAPAAQLREDARRNLTARIAAELSAGPGTGAVNTKTTLDELFDAWAADKAGQGSLSPQSEAQYRRVWRGHGSDHLGALRITELTTSRADGHLKTIPPRQSSLLRTILVGMLSMAVRFDVIHHNPIREAQAAARGERKPARALTAVELERVLRAVKAYAAPSGRSGPPRGVMLSAFVELLAATGARPGEVLAIRW
ncbi:putative phage integrase [Mycobacteroides abscessus subsp. massiliense]|nr:putative phage integrase [Mycobacteroides abscessus subsp. massiliense]